MGRHYDAEKVKKRVSALLGVPRREGYTRYGNDTTAARDPRHPRRDRRAARHRRRFLATRSPRAKSEARRRRRAKRRSF